MKAITSVVFIIVAVFLTSLFWYVVIFDHTGSFPSFGNPVNGPTATPFVALTPQPTEVPTSKPTQQPTATPLPSLQPITVYPPEFLIQFIDRSYEEAPSYTTDPYTNQSKLVWAGGHVDNKTLDITIKNQPFTPYKTSDGKEVGLHFVIRHKGHYQDWTDSYYTDVVYASDSDTTQVTFILGEGSWRGISTNSTIDIQVKAQIGYYYLVYDPFARPWDMRSVFNPAGESDWSGTQTITIP
jgi:hypothetical protein